MKRFQKGEYVTITSGSRKGQSGEVLKSNEAGVVIKLDNGERIVKSNRKVVGFLSDIFHV